jgi:hypothetical protein
MMPFDMTELAPLVEKIALIFDPTSEVTAYADCLIVYAENRGDWRVNRDGTVVRENKESE